MPINTLDNAPLPPRSDANGYLRNYCTGSKMASDLNDKGNNFYSAPDHPTVPEFPEPAHPIAAGARDILVQKDASQQYQGVRRDDD